MTKKTKQSSTSANTGTTASNLLPTMQVQRGGSMVMSNPWAVMPSLGNLESYISAVKRFPILDAEQEQQYARELQDGNSLEAASKLILSHLRLVVSVSRQYLGYGLPHADLIQEGNIGLMKAVRRFDPSQGVRLVSYAMYWIKAEIHGYILRNWRMVKMATTKAQRKLFFNLRSMKQAFKEEEGALTHRDSMSDAEIDTMVQRLGVRKADVVEMETRMSGGDVALDPSPTNEADEVYAPIAYLADTQQEPVRVLMARERDNMATAGVAQALENLDPRSRHIVEARWLQVDDKGGGGKTLHELAAEYGISAERVRQIETQALKKMRAALSG